MRHMGPYENMYELRKKHEDSGGFFFSESTMNFFASEIYRDSAMREVVFWGRYFLTSEQDYGGAWNGERRWTIRFCKNNGNIETFGLFGQYLSAENAYDAVLALQEDQHKESVM